MRFSAWPSAGVASLAPLLSMLAIGLASTAEATPSTHWILTCGASLALVLAGGLTTPRAPRAGRWLSTLGLAGTLGGLGVYLGESPGLGLVAVVGAVVLIGSVWGLGSIEDARLSRRRIRELAEKRARLAASLFVADWGLAVVWSDVDASLGLAAAAGLAIVLGYTAVWAAGARRRKDPFWRGPLVAAFIALVGAALTARSTLLIVSWGGLVPLFVLFMPRTASGEDAFRRTWWQPLVEHPARLLVVTFIALSTLGTLLLLLPLCASSGESIDFVDAAFTAISAVCVTGLIVLDTPVDFSLFGQGVLLVLIQLGGLGIMSFSSLTLSLLGLRPSLRHEAAVAGLLGADHRGILRLALGRIVAFTLFAEAVGALLLTAAFVHGGEALKPALWRGVFTAVSAFCNAGFALQSDNLVGYQQSAWVLHITGALIVIGGLSPATVAALEGLARRRHVAVEHKMALLATGALLFGGAAGILALEWSNTLGELPGWDRVTNAWFQSVTTRTAGFNSIDIAAVRPATLTLLIMLMFVGGSPGGTAGGVKTTTIFVLFLAVVSAIRGRWYAAAFRRRISHRTVYKAASIVTVGALTLLAALFALQITQGMGSDLALFEAASALGTVGLSIGATPLLDEVGKIIVMACMFAGRVGPLSLFLFLQGEDVRSPWSLVEEEVSVG